MYSVVLTNLHHVYKYQAEGFTVGGGVIAFIQIHMANKTNEVRKFCLDFDLRRFDTILIDPEGNISKSRPHIYIYIYIYIYVTSHAKTFLSVSVRTVERTVCERMTNG